MNKTRKAGNKSSIKMTRKIRSHVGGKSKPKKRSDGTLSSKTIPIFVLI